MKFFDFSGPAVQKEISFKIFLFWLWQPLCLAELLGNFGRGPYEESLCKFFLNKGQQFRRGHFKDFSIFSSEGRFVQWSRTVLTILVEA